MTSSKMKRQWLKATAEDFSTGQSGCGVPSVPESFKIKIGDLLCCGSSFFAKKILVWGKEIPHS